MIRIENGKKSYDGRVIWENLNLTFSESGIYCLMGPSGQGKTKLLRCLAGLETLDGGTILGICLGHQTIGQALGATVSYAKELYHGKQSLIYHKGNSIFTDIDSPIKVARYHSLSVLKEGLPDCLEVLAETDDGEIMAMRHREYPVVGMQFHPESIYTQHGKRMIENFLRGVI